MKRSKQATAAMDYVQMSADCISAPGCYVCDWSGHVLRVQGENGQTRRSMMVSIVGSQPLTVTRISADPFIPLSEARLRACNLGDAGPTKPGSSQPEAQNGARPKSTATRRPAQTGARKTAGRATATRSKTSASRRSRRTSGRSRAYARTATSKSQNTRTASPKTGRSRPKR